MTNGPPPSAAGSSQSRQNHASDSSHNTQPSDISTSTRPYYAPHETLPSSTGQAYNGYSTWKNVWPVGAYPYSDASTSAYQSNPHYAQSPYLQFQPSYYQHQFPSQANYSASYAIPQVNNNLKRKTPSPSPSPPPSDIYRHWDEVLKLFLRQAGLTQALRGFESDMLIMNSNWECQKIPLALKELIKNLSHLGHSEEVMDDGATSGEDRPTSADRKLKYVHLASKVAPRTQTSVNREVSKLLAENRARNDASNRTEFLYSLAEKRKRLDNETETLDPQNTSSCARVDAKPLDRDVQMKYDIAKNEDGPLRRTVKNVETSIVSSKIHPVTSDVSADPKDSSGLTPDRHPGLDRRLSNIEDHLSVRYVPSPPRTLLTRLQFLEDHIVRLEKEYPPWAALHFNQPNRGWPPPPRSTPIIVPTHERTTVKDVPSNNLAPVPRASGSEVGVISGGTKARSNASSLHRAVLERLEVQQAMSDLAGVSSPSTR